MSILQDLLNKDVIERLIRHEAGLSSAILGLETTSAFNNSHSWRAERAYLVVQLSWAFPMYPTIQFGPRGCPRATRKRNRPCLFRSPSMRSIQLVYEHKQCFTWFVSTTVWLALWEKHTRFAQSSAQLSSVAGTPASKKSCASALVARGPWRT